LIGEQTEFWEDYDVPKCEEGEQPRTCEKCGKTYPSNMVFFYKTITTVNRHGKVLPFLKKVCKKCVAKQKAQLYKLRKKHIAPDFIYCPICEKRCDKPYMDHDHATGEFRGWLCNDCNNGLGKFKDDVKMLRKAIEYLQGDFKNECLDEL
jgi:hypothetical protein